MGTSSVTPYELVVTFDSLASAQRAITALGIAGIGGESISLEGRAATEARQELATDAADGRILLHILKYIIVGAVLGTVVGAAVSPLAGWIVLTLLGSGVTVKGLLVSLFLTTLMSHMIGGFIGYTMAMQAGHSWELSFQSVSRGEVLLHVRVTDRAVFARAQEALRRQRARS